VSAGEIAFAFLKPSSAVLLLLLSGLILLPLRRRAGVAALALGAGLFAALALLPVGEAALRALEARFPPANLAVAPDTIILLGGYMEPVPARAGASPAGLGDAADRLTAAATLALRFPEARLVVAGNPVGSASTSSAELSADLLETFGIGRERMVLDGGAFSTWDNASRTRERVLPRPGERHLVVTSAFHMPRAIGTFRAAGWPDPRAWPVDHLRETAPPWAGGIDAASALRTADRAAREWLALLVYRLGGRTDALLPAPRPPQ
jgi:uncharacterized SAM-binding protein YcdF (DUF218 family)